MALNDLMDGYLRFRCDTWPKQRENFHRLWKDGQAPKTMILACSDSRVDPQLIFDAAPGQLFTVRNVANMVPPFAPDSAYHGTSAALEFAVKALEIEVLVVLGHARCGGCMALRKGTPEGLGDFLAQWVSLGEPARDAIQDLQVDEEAAQRAIEHEVVKLSINNLMTFPWIAERVAAKRLSLYGLWFDIETGVLEPISTENGAPG